MKHPADSPARGARLLLTTWGFAVLFGLTALHAVADAGALRARYAQLLPQLQHNNFQRALHIDSSEVGNTLQGDVYAVLEHPFPIVRDTLKEPGRWCDILLLPFNTKHCHAAQASADAVLQVRIGRRHDQPAEKAFRLEFAWRPVAVVQDYFESRLSADQGPVGTRDYRIAVAAVPLEGGRTFMHLSYSYAYGFAGRMAMQAYLATAGAGKVGFTVTGKDAGSRPIYIGGMRGAVERNAMRYYLAVDAHLASLNAAPGQQLDKRIQTWFSETERYPLQLHEMDRATYVAMKRGDYERQQTSIE